MPSIASRYSQRPSGPVDDKRRSFKDGWGQAPGGGGASSSAPLIVEKRKQEQPEDDSASKKRRALLEQRRSLPIASVAEKLVEHVKKNDTLVVIGETGSGKTTQLPQFLHSTGFCKGGMMIGITQPRRVAAITVATRVAEEMGTEERQKCAGFSHICDNKLNSIGQDTAAEKKVAVVSNGHSTFQKSTGPLKLVVMSATLDTKGFCDYFNGATAVYVQGRQFPIHMEESLGDILVFLTGQEEIESMERLLRDRATHLPETALKLLVVPIYAALPSEHQMRVFQPAPVGARKVFLGTFPSQCICMTQFIEKDGYVQDTFGFLGHSRNLTYHTRIQYVIDPGLVKARAYNPHTGVESLAIVPVSKAQAQQRRKAVVVQDVRLQANAFAFTLKTLLQNWVTLLTTIVKSLEHLYTLGALNDEGKLSDPLGFRMSRFPLEPLYAKAMLVSSEFGCSMEMLAAVAMLSVESLFYTPRDKIKEANNAKKRFASQDGDHITFINVLRIYSLEVDEGQRGGDVDSSTLDRHASKKTEKVICNWCTANYINGRSLRRAIDIRKQIQVHMESMGLPITSCGEDMLVFRRCLAASFFLNAARRQLDGTYRALSSGQTVSIHPSSVLHGKKPECVVFNELVRTNRSYIRSITQIDSLWLPELAPQYYAALDLANPTQRSLQT
ncbi:unnamed protein product [Sphagnum troendelagicum]|uniref:RNA helicase n=1 Tax=Sphagnum troendelagicum TaxID=128251 RepID=A0ABP0U3U7_9BRYO